MFLLVLGLLIVLATSLVGCVNVVKDVEVITEDLLVVEEAVIHLEEDTLNAGEDLV